MIDWKINYTVSNAAADFEKLTIKDQEIRPIKLTDEWIFLRKQLLQARDEVFEMMGLDNADKLGYEFDVVFGIKLFHILSKKNNFYLREASNDEVWNYLSVKVIPDIVHARYGMNADHFYKISRRVWLKAIWWYVYLAWNGDDESTAELIKGNTTDTIVSMVERPGEGYYTSVYHEILKQYKGHNSRDLFRRVLKLNTARLMTTSPELMEGGVEGYVRDLFIDASDNFDELVNSEGTAKSRNKFSESIKRIFGQNDER